MAADTGAKPFACHTCGRRFNRLDSLSRHERVHARADAQQRSSRDSWQSVSATADFAIQFTPLQLDDNSYQADIGLAPMMVDPAFSEATGTDDFGMTLEWPDSEALLQSINSYNWTSLALPPGSNPAGPSPPVLPQPGTAFSTGSTGDHPCNESQQLSPDDGSREAVQSLSSLVTNLVRFDLSVEPS